MFSSILNWFLVGDERMELAPSSSQVDQVLQYCLVRLLPQSDNSEDHDNNAGIAENNIDNEKWFGFFPVTKHFESAQTQEIFPVTLNFM